MYLYKGLKLSLKEIFKTAEDNKRNGININFIWVNRCDKCGSDIKILDEEYSYFFSSTNKYCTSDEIKNDMNEYNKNYDIYEDMYEEENKDFIYIGLDELNNCDVYYYYRYDFSDRKYCNICYQIWF